MEEEPMIGVPEEEEEGAESSNRMFMFLALGLGGLFVVGLICIGAVFFMQQGQASQVKNANATQIAQNTAVVKTATAKAMPTATQVPTDTPVPPTSPPPPTVAPTDAPIAPAPTLPAPTETAMSTAAAAGRTTAAAPAKVAMVTSAPGVSSLSEVTPVSTPAEGQLSQTGVGGFGMVLAAGVLLVVLFAARRFRLGQH